MVVAVAVAVVVAVVVAVAVAVAVVVAAVVAVVVAAVVAVVFVLVAGAVAVADEPSPAGLRWIRLAAPHGKHTGHDGCVWVGDLLHGHSCIHGDEGLGGNAYRCGRVRQSGAQAWGPT